MDKLSTLESILLAVGFSIAFLMIAGLILNTFGAGFGLGLPLSTLPLSLFLNTLILGGAVVAQFRAASNGVKPPQTVGGS